MVFFARTKCILFCFILVGLLLPSCQKKSDLPELRIITTKKIAYEKKRACLIDYRSGPDQYFLKGNIKRRGGMSLKYNKHSYTLDLEQKIPLGDLPTDNDWILNAGYIDKSFMRHKVAYDLYRQMHSNNLAAQSTYVKAYLNDEYIGLYLLMEKLDGSSLFVDKHKNGAMVFKGPQIFRDSMLRPQFADNVFHQKIPDPLKKDFNGHLKNFRDLLLHPNDSLFKSQIDNWIDLENVIDWHLLLLLTNNTDGVCKNFYLYKRDFEAPFKIAIWDYDHSLGRHGDNTRESSKEMMTVNSSILLRRLLQTNARDYRNKLQQRWLELQDKNILTYENMVAMIDANHLVIQEELDRNFSNWPIDSRWYKDDFTHQQELELIKNYLKERIELMNNQLIVE